jgi:2-C-methyl-D-erythritol 4-phosphate cytidylyltransferase/2-C-methyl-D-erythritol 2,4-cyclodiphosphate synthase
MSAPQSLPLPTIGVIVVAAGSGTRLAQPTPKAFVEVEGRTVLERSLEGVFGMSEPAQVVIVAPEAWLDQATHIGETVAAQAAGYLAVVAGGATRQQSVAAGLAALDADITTVLVHDSARALTPSAQFDAVVAAVRATGDGVIPGLDVADTIKRTADGFALDTVDRSTLTAVQTPQGFPRAELDAAYASSIEDRTDDAALFADAGHHVRVVAGDALAFKITSPWDLRRAESIVRALPASSPVSTPGSTSGVDDAAPRLSIRTGIGIDVHAYDANSPLWLGGLYWPDEMGLAGHSDGDAIAHAMCDALLSAAGLGDIGGRFGTDDPRFENAHGEVFLRATVLLVTGAGFDVQNVAVQLIGNTPRMAGRRLEIEQHLTEMIAAPVSVSATTTDRLGFTGRGEGLTAIATALLSA